MSYYQNATEVIENEQIKLEYMVENSLRLIKLIYKPTGLNLFAETPELGFDTPEGRYNLWGGHRVWVSPELMETTYARENPLIKVEKSAQNLTLKENGLAPQFIYKEMRVQMDPAQAKIHLVESVRNDSVNAITLAPWGLSMMAIGGTAILPLKAGKTEGLLPDRSLALWPYTSFQDPRLKLTDEVIYVNIDKTDQAFKIGMRSTAGWMAYLLQGVAFVLRTYPNLTAVYPDFGCNAEMYTNGKFIELEVLGGLEKLDPGRWAALEEDWEIFPFAGTPEELYKKLSQ
jgi:hypothetical protein